MESTRRGNRTRSWQPAVAVFAAGVAMSAGHSPAWAQAAPPTAPSYTVMSSGLLDEQAMALAQALQVPAGVPVAGSNGGFQYVDPTRFMVVPTVPANPVAGAAPNEDGEDVTYEGLDLVAIRAMMPPGNLAATLMVRRALRTAGITLDGGTAHADRIYFDTFGMLGLRTLHHAIATTVGYSFVTPDGTPLEGPGAKADFSFDATGRASMALVATRRLVRGPDVPILSHDDALGRCSEGAPAGAALTADLVHYAPPLSVTAQAILPHYRCGGTFVDADGHPVSLKTRYLPATLPGGPAGPPGVFVTAVFGGSAVSAHADVVGGTPPYTFHWSSSSTSLPDASFGDSIAYDVVTRDTGAAMAGETVHVSVIDANGLASSARDNSAIPAPQGNVPITPDPSSRTTGVEYQSWTAGLTNSEWTAQAFYQGVQATYPTVKNRFYAAEYNSWAIDFLSKTFVNGRDNLWVDSVDMTYYSSHGNAGEITFSSNMLSHSIYSSQMRLGDQDSEWLALDTCLFLNNDDGKVIGRIKPMFTGLHMVVGFDSTADDTSTLGGIFTDDMFGGNTQPDSHSNGAHLTVVQAWALAAVITNSPEGRWAAMGPQGDANLSDVNDHFWGFGPVGPDIRGTDIKGWWRLQGAT